MLPAACPICELPDCRRERYAVTIGVEEEWQEMVLVHADDKEDAAHFGFCLVERTMCELLRVEYRGGGM